MATHQISAQDFFLGLDSRAMPRYNFAEAARYLGVAESTIRSWFAGMPYIGRDGLRHFQEPILKPAADDLLSFYDTVSAHVLLSIRAERKKRAEKVRKEQEARGMRERPETLSPNDLRDIVQNLEKEFPDSEYPLLGRSFWLFGRDVVTKRLGKRLNLSKHRQLGIKQVMDKFLARIELDANLMPTRFSPLRSQRESGKGFIVIDPDLAAGRPVVRNTGIPAEIIFKRNDSGESVARLAKDYRLTRRAVSEAIKYWKAA